VFEDYLLNLESEIDAYRVRILETVSSTGRVILQDITESLNSLDAVKCFFAALFLARDRMVDLKQEGDDILILVVAGPVTEDES